MSNFSSRAHTAAIIAGTGFERAFDKDGTRQTVSTPYGDVSVLRFTISTREIYLLPRHGIQHTVPPHQVNYRANIWALQILGVKYVLATAAVGSLRVTLPAGSIVVLDDFIDFRNKVTTFYDGSDAVVKHIDFSQPFSSKLRELLIESASELEASSHFNVFPGGTYLCVNGPRYETPAEVKLFGAFGADVVGMTIAPEAILAKEIGIEYAAVAVATNLGTGLSEYSLSHEDVSKEIESKREFLAKLLVDTLNKLFVRLDSVLDRL